MIFVIQSSSSTFQTLSSKFLKFIFIHRLFHWAILLSDICPSIRRIFNICINVFNLWIRSSFSTQFLSNFINFNFFLPKHVRFTFPEIRKFSLPAMFLRIILLNCSLMKFHFLLNLFIVIFDIEYFELIYSGHFYFGKWLQFFKLVFIVLFVLLVFEDVYCYFSWDFDRLSRFQGVNLFLWFKFFKFYIFDTWDMSCLSFRVKFTINWLLIFVWILLPIW